MWWERYLSRMPWWNNAALAENEADMLAAREVYARELSGRVPPLKDRTRASYRHTFERSGR